MLNGLTPYLPEASLTVWDNLEFLARILLATILGIIIGLERTRRQKEAGVRTHCIISCAAAVFMILSKYAFGDVAEAVGVRGADASRIASQVVSGISFLGAGVIFKNGVSIRGLTTAAGMWGTSAVGMAIGAGLYWVGLFEALILVIAQELLHRFPVGSDVLTSQEITVEMENRQELLDAFNQLLADHGGHVVESSITRNETRIRLELSVRIKTPVTHEEAVFFLSAWPEISRISV